MNDVMNYIVELGVTYGGKLLLAIIVLVVGLMIIKAVKKMLDKLLKKNTID